MAYCLRLPLEAAALIEEMRSHWADLAELKAAGGTPSARCLKAFNIIAGTESVFVEARSSQDRIRWFRGFKVDRKYLCRRCRLVGKVRPCAPCVVVSPICGRVRSKSFFYDQWVKVVPGSVREV